VIRTTLKSLAIALAKILEQHGQGARRLEAVFFRADGVVRRIAIEMGAPTRDPTIIDRLFREKLAVLSDPLDPGFGFDLIRLCADRIESIGADPTTFEGAAHDEGEINFLVDRLAARFGTHHILTFKPRDTHIPEEAWISVPAQHAQFSKLPWRKIQTEKDAPRRPLRLFARPEPVNFTAAQYFIWRKARRVVTQCEGPERIAMEWWHHETPQAPRDYFRVEDSVGRRYWLYRQGTPPQWFIHGIFA
jgi:protein ImuB